MDQGIPPVNPGRHQRYLTDRKTCRSTSDIVQALSHRVEELEYALESTRRTPGSTSSPQSETGASPQVSSNISGGVISIAAITSPQPTRFPSTFPAHKVQLPSRQNEPSCKLSRCQLGNNWYFKGIGILSSRGQKWISYGSGQSAILEKFEIFDNPISTRPRLIYISPTEPRVLPPESTCRHIIRDFLSSKTHLVFPVLDKDLINGTIARAYGHEQSDPGGQASAQACLWATFALINRTDKSQQSNLIPGSYECAEEAKRLLFVINGSVNLDSLQANILVVS